MAKDSSLGSSLILESAIEPLKLGKMSTLEEAREQRLSRIDEAHRCRPGNSALVVVDMQHGFLEPGASLEVPKGREIIPNLQRLVEECRTRDMPVIFTEFVYSTTIPCLRGDPFGIEHLPVGTDAECGFGLPSSNCLVGEYPGVGAESADTINALKPRPDELVIQGHTYDKFYGTHLDLALRSNGIDRIMMTGITTDVCVNATLISGATRNYRVTAVTDGVATIQDHIQLACFQIWENKFARLKTTDELIVELAQTSDQPLLAESIPSDLVVSTELKVAGD